MSARPDLFPDDAVCKRIDRRVKRILRDVAEQDASHLEYLNLCMVVAISAAWLAVLEMETFAADLVDDDVFSDADLWRMAREFLVQTASNMGPQVETVVVEGVVYDPSLDSHARGIRTDQGEYVYIEELLDEGDRVRVTIEKIG